MSKTRAASVLLGSKAGDNELYAKAAIELGKEAEMIEFIEDTARQGFISMKHVSLIKINNNPKNLLDLIMSDDKNEVLENKTMAGFFL
jgi:predicted Rossmann-fold nucleotide-binding protein